MLSDLTINLVSDQLISTPGPNGYLSLIQACHELAERGKFKASSKELQALLEQPEIRDALLQREHNDRVIKIQQAEIQARMEALAVLQQEQAKLIATYSGADKDAVIQVLDQQIAQVQAGIDALHQVNDVLSQQINEINQRPEIEALRPLEAHVDLGKEVLKRNGDLAADMIKASQVPVGMILSEISTVADIAGYADLAYQASGVMTGAATGATVLSAATPLVGGVTQIAGGGLQALAGVVSGVNNAYHGVKELQRKANAKEVKERIVDDPVLRAAVERIENKANRNAVERGIKTARDGALVVTGVATVVAGSALVTSGVLAAASAAGGGAAAVPTLALTAAASGVAIGAAAVSTVASASVGVFQVGRHVTSAAAKATCMRAIVGADELLRIGGGAGKLPSDQNGQPMLLKDPNIPRAEAEAILKLQKHAIKTGALTPEQALDVSKIREYAAVRLTSLDTREAVAILGGKLMEECAEAIQRRGGKGIVTSDLPKDTPAVKAARGLGMTDREIVNLVNNLHADITHKIAEQTLAQKTGLRQSALTSLNPVLEPTWEQNKQKISSKANSLLQRVKGKLGFGGNEPGGGSETPDVETKNELTEDELAAFAQNESGLQSSLEQEDYGSYLQIDDDETEEKNELTEDEIALMEVHEKKEKVADSLRSSSKRKSSLSHEEQQKQQPEDKIIIIERKNSVEDAGKVSASLHQKPSPRNHSPHQGF